LSDFVCSPKLRGIIEGWIKEGSCPNLILAGPPGTGKTTLARILIKELNSESLELNASDERGIDVLRDKVKRFAMMQTHQKLKIVLLDEYDYVTQEFMVASRGVIEQFSKGSRFILTCNYLNKIIDAIQSRCKVVKISEMNKKDMAFRAFNILQTEKVEFNVEDLKKVINLFYPDMRKIINTLQFYSKNNILNIDFGEIIDHDFKLKIFECLNNNDLKGIRQIIVNEPVDFIDLFRFLYKELSDVPRAILIIADYLYKDSFVVDKEINFMACCVELLEIMK